LCKYLEPLQNNRNNIKKHPYRILLVDDEPDVTLAFKMGLEDNGYVVDAFNDPILALSTFKQGLNSLVLLDIKMPKMNGFELYKEIRKLDGNVKICFMTAFDLETEKLKEVLHTLDSEKPVVIRKPITIDDLIARIEAELLSDLR
jgi:two-component system, OmpR family, response regulator ChvI